MLYSPGSELVADTASQAETKTETEIKTEAPKQEPPVPKGPSLAEQIRADREAREAAAKREAEAQTLKQRAESAEAELTGYRKAKDNALLDSIGYLETLGFSHQEAMLFAENIMFSLVPDKAPPDHLPRMIKAQRARDEKLTADRQAKEKADAETAAQTEARKQAEALEQDYKASLHDCASTATTEAYPNSVAWFGSDHEDYAESLLHTARNLATAAQKAGKLADLSPANVAAVLEKTLNDRAARIRAPQEKPSPEVSKQSPAPGQLPLKKDETKKPDSKSAPLTESERIARATRAAFPNG